MKKIITYGTFDLIHRGHINILKRAAELGDHLTVVLSTDKFNAGKHKQAYHSYEDRKFILESIKYVDEVLPEISWDQKTSDIQDNDIEVFVMGDDWDGEFDFLKEHCEVKYLSRTSNISTSMIKSNLRK